MQPAAQLRLAWAPDCCQGGIKVLGLSVTPYVMQLLAACTLQFCAEVEVCRQQALPVELVMHSCRLCCKAKAVWPVPVQHYSIKLASYISAQFTQ